MQAEDGILFKLAKMLPHTLREQDGRAGGMGDGLPRFLVSSLGFYGVPFQSRLL